jgi:hypothetical protein
MVKQWVVLKFATTGQCYEAFCHCNLLPFHGNNQSNVALRHRMTELTWNGGKLQQ